TPAEYRRYLNLVAEQRVVSVATIDPQAVADEIGVSEEMVAAYYEDNPDEFRLPEAADVEYIEISRAAVAEDIAVSDDEIEAYYADNRERWLQDEQRRASHILVLTGDDADAARARAAEALARVQAGEPFAAVAADVSEDTGTAEQGGDLGALTRSQLQEELAGIVFSMAEGDVEGPIESSFGYHVVKLDEILERGPLPLDQVRSEILAELRQQEAEARFRDLERSLSDALFDSSSLAEVADATGLDVQSATGITRSGGEPFGANQAAIGAIFADGVLSGEQLSDIVELDADRSAIFKVTEHREATRLPLDDVRDEVVAALEEEQAEGLMQARAEQMQEALDAGEEFAAAAAAAGLAASAPQTLTRTSEAVDPALRFEVFAAGKPTTEDPVYGRVRLQEGGFAVYEIEAVLPGQPESIPLAERDQGKLMMAQESGMGDLQAFVQSLYEDADIEINEDLLAAGDLFQ
ncbi:MAG TPA: peptidyl-prolyl cis-trans isomerase, partial [Woeseiaceae bacterium]|nr:peptidyl-prolyl cis-trans isomerase [Woeseiaceae bacterium]